MPEKLVLPLQFGELTIYPVEDWIEPAWLYPAIAEMNELTKLEYDWDSYGADPISEKCLLDMLHILLEKHYPDGPCFQFVPTPSGGVQAEYHDKGVDFEFEVTPNKDPDFLINIGKNEYDSTNTDIDECFSIFNKSVK